MKLLDGKVVLVTGATSGIGYASALLFAQHGAKVALVGRREELGRKVEQEIVQAGGEAFYLQADLADLEQIEPTVTAAAARFGRVDAAFNNAGVGGGRGRIESRTIAEVDLQLNVNFRSAFFCLQAQVAQFRRQGGGGGAVLFNASALGSMGIPGTMVYGAAKGGVISLARGAAVELGPEGIRVNTVSPSITRTAMTAPGFAPGEDGTLKHPVADITPLRRIAEPTDIAQAALFLLSDYASFITGHDLVVDGGLLAA